MYTHFINTVSSMLCLIFILFSTLLLPILAHGAISASSTLAAKRVRVCFPVENSYVKHKNTLEGEWVFVNSKTPKQKEYCSGQIHRTCSERNKAKNGFPRKFKTDSCFLPDFDEEKFVLGLGGRALVFVGDSVIMQQKVRLKCDIMNSSMIDSIRISHEHHLVNNLDRLAMIHSNSIALVNVGLHYNSRKLYAQFLKKFEDLCLRKKCTNAKLVWQETAAQHFPRSSNGYFQKRGTCREGCSRISRVALKTSDFRNQMANRLLRRYNIPILNVWELTQDAHEMHIQHISKTGLCDCTHFCNTKWGVFRAYNRVLQAWLLQDSPHKYLIKSH